MNKVDAAQFLGAIITDGADELIGSVDRLGVDAVYTLINAASLVAVERKFDASTSPDQIQEYVAGLKERFADQASQIKPAVVEAVIRATLGEGQLLEGLDRDDIVSTMFLLTYAIMSHENLGGQDKDAYIDEVFNLATGG